MNEPSSHSEERAGEYPNGGFNEAGLIDLLSFGGPDFRPARLGGQGNLPACGRAHLPALGARLFAWRPGYL